jgi:glycine dehydrogenase
MSRILDIISSQRSFADRHIGIQSDAIPSMLSTLGVQSLNGLIDKTIPSSIRIKQSLDLPKAASEEEAINELKQVAAKNKVWRSFIGTGYYGCHVPNVIKRNIFENPGWYTQYTPYQAEIAQGRLEALLNFQTMIVDLTGLDVSNASLLDEATAAAEAMMMAFSAQNGEKKIFLIDKAAHLQTIDVVKTRAKPQGIHVEVVDLNDSSTRSDAFGILCQYPGTDGSVRDVEALFSAFKKNGAQVIAACDLLSLVLLRSPGELGADIAIGSAQRFGVPMGFGGPHAAFIAAKDEHKRRLPGRIVGLSKDREGRPAIRLALQTREQHIRREKATSNICTSQVLLAVMAGMYAVYHGGEGLTQIASRVHGLARLFAAAILKNGQKNGLEVLHKQFFDTVAIKASAAQKEKIISEARKREMNLRVDRPDMVCVSFDETTTVRDLKDLIEVFLIGTPPVELASLEKDVEQFKLSEALTRKTAVLDKPIFKKYRSESEFMRYIRSLEAKDLSLTSSMIPLGSCTMKLNAASELYPVSWPEFANIHPFVPSDQAQGYHEMFQQLQAWLAEITGFDGVSLQPNSGSQGEYAGLLVINAYHKSRGEEHRNVCLIPQSAHGTNPASAALAGMKIVVTACDKSGNIDIADLKEKAELHKEALSCVMVTYPSTHGVFEEGIKEICAIIHGYGGQVYMDGANMNAQVGLCRPGDFGPDVCHLNLHKTFCIPHGGGGPGMGPIAVAKHLTPFLPGHVFSQGQAGKSSTGAVSAANWGSASILPISWMYIRMMGPDGLKKATEIAILNANYIAKRIHNHFPVLYRGKEGQVAHECIIDLRPFKASAGIEVEDVAKRLMDYGFHAPTVSFPVAGTLMIEPTESEDRPELDRFCEAMISIRKEISQIECGEWDKQLNPLKFAPHTASDVTSDSWDRKYSREKAAFPSPSTKGKKFWPSVARIDSAYGDRNLVCSCPDISQYMTS